MQVNKMKNCMYEEYKDKICVYGHTHHIGSIPCTGNIICHMCGMKSSNLNEVEQACQVARNAANAELETTMLSFIGDGPTKVLSGDDVRSQKKGSIEFPTIEFIAKDRGIEIFKASVEIKPVNYVFKLTVKVDIFPEALRGSGDIIIDDENDIIISSADHPEIDTAYSVHTFLFLPGEDPERDSDHASVQIIDGGLAKFNSRICGALNKLVKHIENNFVA